MRTALFGLLACSLATITPARAEPAEPGPWKPVPGHIMTRWAADVKPNAPLPEYPRPTMVRETWLNLNGMWEYRVTHAPGIDADKPVESGRILVPFPYESALSGVGRHFDEQRMISYTRTFTIPEGWSGKGPRVLLHFGAVNWHSEVSVNGKKIGTHDGGYDPFSFDITDALRPGANELSVDVRNPINTGGQPRGKQWLKPHGIWYTASTGIWQTVWLEPVPRKSIAGMTIKADRADGKVTIDVLDSTQEAHEPLSYEAEILRDGKRIAIGRSQSPGVAMNVPKPHDWTPEDPFLYDVVVRTFEKDKLVDEVKSYVAFRDIKLGHDEKGVTRLMLNGKPVFMYGPLDQGFWPDGLYTAPTDEALKSDIVAAKRMGCNMLRKHVKVEPERFYTHCDQMGILVWQDMPSAFFASRDSNEGEPAISDVWKTNFEHELGAMINALRSHPSIVMWVPLNEGWGQNDLAWSRSVALKNKELDPTRLVNNATGWTDMGVGDTRDIHNYPEAALPPIEMDSVTGARWGGRAAVLGEFGGLGLPLEGHTWVNNKDNWGYRTYKSKEEVTTAYVELLNQIPALIAQGLCAAVYTQTTDVEVECNGWLTYDRDVWKVDPEKASAATKQLYLPPPTIKVMLGHAPESDGPWNFTKDDPGADWFKPEAATRSWREGPGGFGSDGTPGAFNATKWTTSDIWLRRSFTLAEAPAHPYLQIHHDEGAEVYINGTLAAKLPGYTTSYQLVRLSPEAAGLLTVGANTLAIHCHQTTGGQYIDCGLVDIAPAK